MKIRWWFLIVAVISGMLMTSCVVLVAQPGTPAAPALETVMPALATAASVLETAIPAVEIATPDVETVTPAVEIAIPALATAMSALATAAPALATAMSALETAIAMPAPAVEAATPAVEATTLAVETATPAPATPTPAALTPEGGPVKVNLEEIFPPGEGRDLVLNSCTNCHSIAVIVRGRDRGRWERTSMDHRSRVIALSDEEFKTLYEYLIATFTPDKPIPELPQALLNAWPLY